MTENNYTVCSRMKSTCFCFEQRWLDHNMHGYNPFGKLAKRYSTLANCLVVLQNFASTYQFYIICCFWYNLLVYGQPEQPIQIS